MSIQMQPIKDQVEALVYKTTRVWDYFDKEIKESFLRRVAGSFRAYLVQAIVSQEFTSSYDKLSNVYVKWKTAWGLPLDFWKQYGTLYRNFEITKTDNGYSISIAKGVMPHRHKSIFSLPWKKKQYAAEKISVADYGFYMEFGRSNTSKFGPQPPRPLFHPAFKSFKERQFKRMLESEKARIRKQWG